MTYHAHRHWIALLLGLALVDCRETPVVVDNILDPAADNYEAPFDPSNGLLIDNFERGDGPRKRNLLGYCPEPFNVFATIKDSYVHDGNRHRTVLRLDYDVSGPGDPFGGYIQFLTGTSACPSSDGTVNIAALRFRSLTFWMKSSSERVDMEVALKDALHNQTFPKRLTGEFETISTSWHKVRISLAALVPGAPSNVNLQQLHEINFGFARERFGAAGLDSRGAVFVDEIALEW